MFFFFLLAKYFIIFEKWEAAKLTVTERNKEGGVDREWEKMGEKGWGSHLVGSFS